MQKLTALQKLHLCGIEPLSSNSAQYFNSLHFRETILNKYYSQLPELNEYHAYLFWYGVDLHHRAYLLKHGQRRKQLKFIINILNDYKCILEDNKDIAVSTPINNENKKRKKIGRASCRERVLRLV